MDLEQSMVLPTPEGVDVSIHLAGVGSRFIATSIDASIESVVIILVFLASGIGESTVQLGVAIVLMFLVLFGYDVAFETLNGGRTPGKAATGLRVVGDDGRPVTFVTSAVRNLLRLVDFLPVAYLVGSITMLVTIRNQRLGDLAAGTVVVRERREYGALTVAPAPPVPVHVTSAWDASQVSAEEVAAVRTFLSRRGQLTMEARQRLAFDLASRLRPKVVTPDAGDPPEVFLEKLAAAKVGAGGDSLEDPTFASTHTVPPGGLLAWELPTGALPPLASLAEGTPVRVVEQRGGWAQVMASNGWTGWVDGRRLWIPGSPPPPPPPLTAGSSVRHGGAPAPAAEIGVNGLATASLVFGLLWLLWIGSLLAITFGAAALRKLNSPYNAQTGRPQAIAGLALGIGECLLLLLGVAFG